jgi:SNF family Na+-dependent transporter
VGGTPVLDIVDNAAGTVGLLITSLLTSVVFSWYLARRDMEPQIRSRRWTSVVIFVTRYIVPVVIVAVLVLTAPGIAVPGG